MRGIRIPAVTDETSSAAAQLGTRAVSNAAVILGARVISRLVSLVVVIVLANALGPNGYGRYTTLIAYSALVSVIADLGFNPLFTREAARNRPEIGAYLGTLLVLKVALAAAAMVILAVTLRFGAGLPELILPGAALLAATAYANLLRNTFYAVGRAEFDAVAIIAEIAIQAGLIIAGARAHAEVTFFVWAYVASFAFTIVYSLVVIRVFRLGQVRIDFDFNLVRRWFLLALPFAFTFFLTNLYFRADVPILQHFRSFAEVGWYQFAYKPFEALQFVPLAIQAVVYPLLGVYFVSDTTRLKTAYARFFKVLVLLGWPLTVGTFVLVHPIGRLFRLYAESEASLRILAFAIVFLFANSSFYAMLNATNRQHLNAWATGLGRDQHRPQPGPDPPLRVPGGQRHHRDHRSRPLYPGLVVGAAPPSRAAPGRDRVGLAHPGGGGADGRRALPAGQVLDLHQPPGRGDRVSGGHLFPARDRAGRVADGKSRPG